MSLNVSIAYLIILSALAGAFLRLPAHPLRSLRVPRSRQSPPPVAVLVNPARRLVPRGAVATDCIDITPAGDGGVIKRILKRGNPEIGFPRPRDVIELRWVLAHANGTVIRRSEQTSDPFLHIVGQEESVVIPAWELAVPTMLQGEVAALIIAPQYGFGEEGAPPFVGCNETLLCELHMLGIAANAVRNFQQIAEDEDIREQLAESIYDGKSPVSENVLRNRAVSEHKSASGPGGEPLMFDPSVHNVDPKQRVEGRADGYRWVETMQLIEVEVDLPPHVKAKGDISVELTKHHLSVTDTKTGSVMLSGDLFGVVNPTCSSWVLSESSALERSLGDRADTGRLDDKLTLKLSIEKSFVSRDIWASLFK